MTDNQVKYIGRQKETDFVKSLFNRNDTQVVCVGGPGGIGKSRFLQELQNLASGDSFTNKVLVTDTIDLDNPSFQIAEGINQKIMDILGIEYFHDYLRSLSNWRNMEIEGVSQLSLSLQKVRVNQSFINCFNSISSNNHVVLLFDTTDRQENTDTWKQIRYFCAYAENCTILLAGRNAEDIYSELSELLNYNVHLITIPPLNSRESEQYILEKETAIHIVIEPNITHKITMLAKGKPILIDLAVEWIARDVPIDWLTKIPTDGSSVDNSLEAEIYDDLERNLVKSIGQLRTQIHRLILVLSYVYPLDVPLLADLLSISAEEAEHLFLEALTFAFIKRLPEKFLSLHDEMRRLVTIYIKPEVDPDGSRQRRDSKIAANYYTVQAKELRNQIAELTNDNLSRKDEKANRFAEQLWVVEKQRLQYSLFADLQEGFKLFLILFDEATKIFNYRVRSALIAQTEHFVSDFNETQLDKFFIRKATYLHDISDYDESAEILTYLIDKYEVRGKQSIGFLLQRGRVLILKGMQSAGVKDLQEAVTLSDQIGTRQEQIESRIALGWGTRHMGRYGQACDLLQKALAMLNEAGVQKDSENTNALGLMRQRAEIFNNLIYVLERIDPATYGVDIAQLMIDGEELWKTINDKRGLADFYLTCQYVYRRRESYEDAIAYSESAFDIFHSQNDIEGSSRVSMQMGTDHREKAWIHKLYGQSKKAQQELSFAENSLNRALAYKVPIHTPEIYYWLGETYITADNLAQAQEANTLGLELARNPREARIYWHLAAQQCQIAARMGHVAKINTLREAYEKYRQSEWEDVQHPPADGMFFYYLGDLALQGFLNGQDHLEDQVITYFEEAIPKLAQYMTYGPYQLKYLIVRLDKNLYAQSTYHSSIIRRKLGLALRENWYAAKQGDKKPTGTFLKQYSEALEFFEKWQN